MISKSWISKPLISKLILNIKKYMRGRNGNPPAFFSPRFSQTIYCLGSLKLLIPPAGAPNPSSIPGAEIGGSGADLAHRGRDLVVVVVIVVIPPRSP